jgi:Fe2+ or Zn2+ uptake regulation protein
MKAKSFAEMINEDRRITMLRAIESADGALNEALLTKIVNDFGIRTSRDQIRTELNWLKEQGLIDIDDIADLYIAKLNHRGLDVAQGHVRVPGIARPLRNDG